MPDINTMILFGIAAMNLLGVIITYQTKQIGRDTKVIAAKTEVIAAATQVIAQKTEKNTNSIVSQLVAATKLTSHAAGMRDEAANPTTTITPRGVAAIDPKP